ncbi:hypothetical protein ABEW19_28115 [Paenibacillus illinoisensis]|uniref:hypothetical protein n=1 Tax=Paenibacillus illinoisensis TaxID=59845 RepID=UPI003D29F530
MLDLEIDVPRGKIEEEMYLGNLPFEEYLITLYLTGHIQFEDDLFIVKLAARFREGYRLRYFGVQNSDERYLYKHLWFLVLKALYTERAFLCLYKLER